MSKKVIRLFPGSGETETLLGLYLRRPIVAEGNSARPIVYANFLTSLDGRIALYNDQQDQHVRPHPPGAHRAHRHHRRGGGQDERVPAEELLLNFGPRDVSRFGGEKEFIRFAKMKLNCDERYFS